MFHIYYYGMELIQTIQAVYRGEGRQGETLVWAVVGKVDGCCKNRGNLEVKRWIWACGVSMDLNFIL